MSKALDATLVPREVPFSTDMHSESVTVTFKENVESTTEKPPREVRSAPPTIDVSKGKLLKGLPTKIQANEYTWRGPCTRACDTTKGDNQQCRLTERCGHLSMEQ